MSYIYELLVGEELVEKINYKGVAFEVVSRPATLWVGKLAYAADLVNEPYIGGLLDAYRALTPVQKNKIANNGWDVCISIDYWRNGASPRGMMFAQETLSEHQDERYDVYQMPASLFMRAACTSDSAALLDKNECAVWELFGVMRERVMPLYNYVFNENGAQEIEYYNHAKGLGYAYVPVLKM